MAPLRREINMHNPQCRPTAKGIHNTPTVSNWDKDGFSEPLDLDNSSPFPHAESLRFRTLSLQYWNTRWGYYRYQAGCCQGYHNNNYGGHFTLCLSPALCDRWLWRYRVQSGYIMMCTPGRSRVSIDTTGSIKPAWTTGNVKSIQSEAFWCREGYEVQQTKSILFRPTTTRSTLTNILP